MSCQFPSHTIVKKRCTELYFEPNIRLRLRVRPLCQSVLLPRRMSDCSSSVVATGMAVWANDETQLPAGCHQRATSHAPFIVTLALSDANRRGLNGACRHQLIKRFSSSASEKRPAALSCETSNKSVDVRLSPVEIGKISVEVSPIPANCGNQPPRAML